MINKYFSHGGETRGIDLLQGERFKRELRSNIFTKSMLGTGNVLTQEAVETGTLTKFKTFRQVHG